MNIFAKIWAWLIGWGATPTIPPTSEAEKPAPTENRIKKAAQTPADYDPPAGEETLEAAVTDNMQSPMFDIDAYLDGLNNKQLADIAEYGPDVPAGVNRKEVMRLAAIRYRQNLGNGGKDTWHGLDHERYNALMAGTFNASQAEQLFRTSARRLGLTRESIPAKYRAAWDKAHAGNGMGR